MWVLVIESHCAYSTDTEVPTAGADPAGGNPAMPHPFWQWTLVPFNKGKKFSLNFPNLCDNVVKKLVSEIRKCCWLPTDHYIMMSTWSHAQRLVYIFQNYVMIFFINI